MQDSYRELFLSESPEYLNNINNYLVKLEENPKDLEALNEIFRSIHTLKGMSATMGYERLAEFTHYMEDLLDGLRSQRKKVSPRIIDVLFGSVDALGQLIEEIRLRQEPKIDLSAYLINLKKVLLEETTPLPKVTLTRKKKKKIPFLKTEDIVFGETELKRFKEAEAKGLHTFKVKISLAPDCVMKQARAFLVITNLKKMGEVIECIPSVEDLKEGKFDCSFVSILLTSETKESLRQELLGICEVQDVFVDLIDIEGRLISTPPGPISYIKKMQSVRIPAEKLDKIMNLMGELTIAKSRLLQIVQSYKMESLEEVCFSLDRLTSGLQDEIIQTRLLPVAYILDVFPRVVRDLARKKNKDVDLEIMGSEIELDRIILDEIGDLLVHLVRNAIDHGIETPQERKALGKSPQGKIQIKIIRQKGQIFIEVIDDGKGVDFAEIGKIAVDKGLILKEGLTNLDEKTILDLLTSPGFSTSREVTDISGRGVGLDVVKTKIEALGGRLDFETREGEGSHFILTLPLTVAIIKAMLVKVGKQIFAIPLMSIRETIKIKESEIKFLQNFEIMCLRDEVIPIVRLNKELDIPGFSPNTQNPNKMVSVIVVEYGKKTLGLVVDEILSEQDIVVKPLGGFVRKTKGIAGATILGDGTVALILDTMSLR